MISAFQPTSSAWRTTCKNCTNLIIDGDFNPRPPHGGRRYLAFLYFEVPKYFNPRPPHGGRRNVIYQGIVTSVISTHVLRMEDDIPSGELIIKIDMISTHVLRMEDDGIMAYVYLEVDISTHVLRMEDDFALHTL